MTENELVHLTVPDGIATITLDSPHNRNAISHQLGTELAAHLAAADAELDATVREVLQALRAGSPQGLAESKKLVTRQVLREFDDQGEAMVGLSARLFGSEEAREGMRSFLERRPPRWAS